MVNECKMNASTLDSWRKTDLVYRRNLIITFFLFVIYPLGTLPLLIYEIWRGERYALTLLAVFMGLCAVLFAPVTDLYRHTMDYYYYKSGEPDSFLQVLDKDVILRFLSFTFAKLGIHFEIVRFIFVFLSYQIFFFIYQDIVDNNEFLKNNRWYGFVFFLIMFITPNFFGTTLGLRSDLARAFVMLAFYLFYKKQYLLHFIFLMFACATHYSIWPIAFAFLLIEAGVVRLNKKITFFVFPFCIVFSAVALNLALNLLPSELANSLNTYINGDWGSEVNKSATLNGLIFSYLLKLPLIPLGIFVIFYEHSTKIYQLVLFFVLLLGLLFSFPVILWRMQLIFIGLVTILFFKDYSYSKSNNIILFFLIFCSIIPCFASFYANRDFISVSREKQLLYSPLPLILQNTYSEEWIDVNIDSEGFPYDQFINK